MKFSNTIPGSVGVHFSSLEVQEAKLDHNLKDISMVTQCLLSQLFSTLLVGAWIH